MKKYAQLKSHEMLLSNFSNYDEDNNNHPHSYEIDGQGGKVVLSFAH
jgi:hypothetical protein